MAIQGRHTRRDAETPSRRWALVIALGLVSAGSAWAYDVYPWRWADAEMPIRYYVNTTNIPSSHGDTVTPATFMAAVDGAFQAWQDITTCYITFEKEGVGSADKPYVYDGHNTLGFATLPAGTAGMASIWADGNDLEEVDIRLNTLTGWSIGALGGSFDVQGVLTHEIGHLVGLKHSSVSGATMWPSVGSRSLSWRTLHDDDIAGATALYLRELIPGDANADGQVDDDDLSILLANWSGAGGAGGAWETGDFDGNGAVSDVDLSLLLANWGATETSAAPEPATWALLLFGAALTRGKRRNRASGPRTASRTCR